MRYYKSFTDDNGYIYSLDMVRLNFDLGNNTESFTKYLEKLSSYDLAVDVKYFPSFQSFKYRHLWQVSVPADAVSFSIGLDFTGTSDSKNKGFLEFNPNKCELSNKFAEIRKTLFSFFVTTDVIRFDCAIDLPLERRNVKLIKEKGKNYQFISKDDGVTEYLGVRSNHGFVKVYDKTMEAGLAYPCTRVEITIDAKKDFNKVFPKVWLYDQNYKLVLDDSLSSTQKAFVYCLRQTDNPNWILGTLRYELKKKIEPYLYDKVLLPQSSLLLSVKMLALSYQK